MPCKICNHPRHTLLKCPTLTAALESKSALRRLHSLGDAREWYPFGFEGIKVVVGPEIKVTMVRSANNESQSQWLQLDTVVRLREEVRGIPGGIHLVVPVTARGIICEFVDPLENPRFIRVRWVDHGAFPLSHSFEELELTED